MTSEISKKLFDLGSDSFVIICLTALGTFVALMVYTRIFGKRSFSKMSSFDFSMTVAIGSIIATTVVSSSVTLVQGIIGLGAVYLIQLTAAFARRYDWFKTMVDNQPLLLMDESTILYENLKKARVTKEDLISKLREANVLNISQVKAVVFEATGDISVLHSDKENLEVEDWLLEGVKE
ncbi:DUF421 domain-containing protein [Aureibaculum sp. 2210JD6-5]|uniref:DUF421 domain-containing protein n=1 Tax=Aureibaculum sp. 2210JD6-5 TaxID=3103957 RepID=UPI002AAC6372|nr:YetF domain-containing protein [Aureibaculum sp. 2210JD6-5]MDY7394974.1 DUF421 domain-containing protein [Aureibaculum sp. 2210JD6-5]